MANYLKEAFKALFGGNNDNNKEELKKAEEAGNKAAERGAKNAGFVPTAKINETKAVNEAKKVVGEKTKGKDEGR